MTLTEILEQMTLLNAGFKYQMFQGSNGKITGCIWQTAVMRDNFERFGNFVCVDSMKRELNTYAWPYMAISMYNEMDLVCVGCEGIMCSEREEAY
jgi:hypothetical protein